MNKAIKALFFCLVGLSSFTVYAEHDAHEMKDYSVEFKEAKPAKDIDVEKCWVRLMPNTLPSAGYFIVSNNSDADINLLAARTDQFQITMLHESFEEDGLSKMEMAKHIQIKAGDSLEFKPGGLHAMFEEPIHTLNVGDELNLELLFTNNKKKELNCRVHSASASAY